MIKKIIEFYYRRKAIFKLKRRYYEFIQVDKLMESFVTHQIVNSQDSRQKSGLRQRLLQHQHNIMNQEEILDFLKKL